MPNKIILMILTLVLIRGLGADDVADPVPIDNPPDDVSVTSGPREVDSNAMFSRADIQTNFDTLSLSSCYIESSTPVTEGVARVLKIPQGSLVFTLWKNFKKNSRYTQVLIVTPQQLAPFRTILKPHRTVSLKGIRFSRFVDGSLSSEPLLAQDGFSAAPADPEL